MKKNIFAKSETEYPYSIVLQPHIVKQDLSQGQASSPNSALPIT